MSDTDLIRFSYDDFLHWNKWYEEYTGESRQNRTTDADYLAWLEYQKGCGHAETEELEIKLDKLIILFRQIIKEIRHD